MAKYYFYTAICWAGLVSVITIDSLTSSTQLAFSFAIFCFCAGYMIPFILLLATFDSDRIDTSRSTFSNNEGVHWGRKSLVLVPFFVFFVSPELAIKWQYFLLGIGGIGLLAHRIVLYKLAHLLKKRKYIMLEGFRQ